MKKYLRILYLLLLSMAADVASAYDVEIDGIYYNLIPKAKVAEVAGSSIREGSIVIPETVTYEDIDYSVKIICNRAFDNYAYYSIDGTYGPYRNLTSVTIPNSVTSIGDEAFKLCIGLTSVTIGNGVSNIGVDAFSGCRSLKKVIVPDIAAWCRISFSNYSSNPLSCSEHLFSDENTEIIDLVIPNGVTHIGNYAFMDYTSLTSINIPESVISIGNLTFYNCNALKYVTIPNGVTSIGNSAFSGCRNLASVNIPNRMTNIGDSTFYECYSLTSVIIPNGITSIGEKAFYGCFHMNSLTISNSVISIGEHAFWGCSSLTFITIPNSVTCIGRDAFSRCSGLTSISIPSSLKRIEQGTFYGCSSLTSVTIPNTVTYIGYSAFARCTSLTSINIPNSVTEIDGISYYSGAFQNCSNLTSISIGSGITSIGNHTFANCTQLKDVYCYAENVPNTKSDAFEDSYIGYTTLHVPAGSADLYKSTLPWSGFGTIVPLNGDIENETCIDGIYYNFSENKAEVTNGDIAYSGAVVIPSSVTYKGKTYNVTCIGNNAFADCSNMTSIKLPSTLKRIKAGAFKNCTSLSKIIVTDIASWCGIVYDGNTSSDFPMYYAKHLYSDEITEVKDVVIPKGVTRIEAMAFCNAKYITSITIPKNVTYIGREAFRGMQSLTSIVFPQDITLIEPYTCQDCEGLAFIIIPEGVTYIGENTFAKCYDLKDFYCYAEKVPNASTNVFYESPIASATLHVSTGSINLYKSTSPWNEFEKIIPIGETPTSGIIFADANVKALCIANWDTNKDGELSEDEAAKVRSIGNVFKGNTNITSFDELQYFTELTEITNYAFENCTGLTSVVIPYGVTSIGSCAFKGCNSLTSVTIPNSVTSIVDYAFKGCNNLTSIDIPESVTSISYSVFDGCSSLTSVTIPNGVTNIGSYTFSGCSSLTSITIPNSVTKIDYCAFYKCTKLFSVRIGSGVTDIGDYTFASCSQITDVFCYAEKVPSTGNSVFSYSPISSATLHVPTGSVNLYKSTSPWSGFGSIIPFGGEIEEDDYIDGIYYNFTDNEAEVINGDIIYSGKVVIPSSVFYKGKTYPVTSIGENAFSGCTGLTSVTIPNSVTAIGLEAFRGCSGLTSITIPASVTYVGDNAFKGCTSLKNVSMETNKPNKHFTRNNSDERWHDHVAISGTQGVNDSEDYTMLLDNDINTKWCVAHVDGTIYIEFDATCPIKPTEYMLTTGNDTQSNPGRNPKSWIIKGRNSTSDDWTTLTTVDDGNMPSESFVSKTFSLNTNTAYRYYRFEVTSLVSGTIFQLSEFCFLINDTSDNKRWLNYIATAGTPGFDTSENYPKLLDNDISTKWCTEYINGSIFIEFDATSSITPIGYELTTGNDTYWESGRNPKSWIIKGRNETSDEWTTLTTVDDGNMPSESYASKTFSLNTNTSYRYYRFEVTSLVSGTIFQLSEFCFLVSDNNDEPIDDDTDVLVLGSNGSSPLFADCPLDSVFIGRNISYSTSSDKGYSPFYCNTPLRSVNISGAAKEVFSKEFYGCTNLKNVQIGGKMLTIGDYAFYGCTGLKEFYCEAEQTPAVTSSSFKNVDVSAVMLVVPDNSVELYKAHPIWKLFWVETPTGIKETNSLTSGLSKGEGDWYDLQGRKLAEPQKGINIIRYCDGTTRKVMIR